MNVLLIEDNESEAKAMLSELSKRGVMCRVAINGDIALQTLLEFSPDAILLDMILPDTTAASIIGKINRIRDNIPIIMVTGYGSKDSAIEYMKMGVRDYLTKPVNIDTLVSSIRGAIIREDEQPQYRKGHNSPEDEETMDQKTLTRIETKLEYLDQDMKDVKAELKELKEKSSLEVFCDKCLARRIIYWLVAIMGAGVLGAVLALVLRSPK
jgi:DNA-binding response OmpR family regulator